MVGLEGGRELGASAVASGGDDAWCDVQEQLVRGLVVLPVPNQWSPRSFVGSRIPESVFQARVDE